MKKTAGAKDATSDAASPPAADAPSTDDGGIGVSLFDSQYNEIVALMKRLVEESRTASNAAYLNGRLQLLQAKVRRYFAHQDEYMRHSGYPARNVHREDHAELLESLAGTGVMSPNDEVPALVRSTVDAFGERLRHHATEHDLRLGHYLSTKGIR